MAERIQGKQAVFPQEVVVAQAYELEVPLTIVERKGLLTRAKIPDEIARQKKDRARAH